MTNEEAKAFLDNLKICIEEHPIVADWLVEIADRKTEPLKTADYCDICKQDMCKDCIADATNPYCVPSHYEIKQTENSSEKANNCEHITEDGVTCAKYPACDDCLDNPLNKLKGSERLVKGSEQTDCQTCKWWSSCGYCVHRECKGYAPQTEREGE